MDLNIRVNRYKTTDFKVFIYASESSAFTLFLIGDLVFYAISICSQNETNTFWHGIWKTFQICYIHMLLPIVLNCLLHWLHCHITSSGYFLLEDTPYILNWVQIRTITRPRENLDSIISKEFLSYPCRVARSGILLEMGTPMQIKQWKKITPKYLYQDQDHFRFFLN